MPVAPETSNETTDAIATAVEKKIQRVFLTAIVSILVALISLAGTVYSTRVESQTQEKLQTMEERIQMSEQAIKRAEKVAEEYEKLLSSTQGENKRLAFLNLWHLHSGDEHRKLLLLTGLQFAGRDVFELLLVLTPELGDYEEVFAKLTDSQECPDETVSSQMNDCGTTEFAKKLLAKLNPERAFEILLDDVSERPLTSRKNTNLNLLRHLIQIHPDLTAQLQRDFQRDHSDVLGLSYLLYQNDIEEPFREVLAKEHDVKKRVELVAFLSGWPLTDLSDRDREALIEFLDELLDDISDPFDFAPVIETIGKMERHIDGTKRAELGGRIADLLLQEDLTWTIRSAAAEVLASLDLKRLIDTVHLLDDITDENPLSYPLARTLSQNHFRLAELYPAAEKPPGTDEFTKWRTWITEVKSG